MASTNVLNITDYGLGAKMLGDAIPAESFAAGRNETGGLAGNYNFQGQQIDGWPRNDRESNPLWYHSDVKDVSFFFTHPFFIRVVKGNSP